MPSFRAFAFGCFAAAAAGAASFAFDLDVAVPSGTPLEWKSDLPQRYVRPESPFTLARGDDERYAPPPTRPAVRALGVVRPEEVLTLDFAGHLGFQPLEFPRDPTGAASADRPYPPRPDVDLYWRTTISLLQMLLHPARVLRLEVLGRLTILGEGALPALEAAASMGELSDETRTVREAIGRTPPRPPDPPDSKRLLASRDTFESMMLRLVAQEICLARPYASDLRFAERLLLIRDDVVPYVAPFLESDHSLARRNAAALLALLDTPGTTGALAKALATSADPVVKLRAIHGLARRRARGAAPALRAALSAGPEPVLEAALIRALGEIGDPDAVPLLLNAEGPASVRGELVIERLAALIRIGAFAKPDAVTAFAARWLTVRGEEAGWIERRDPSPMQPDSPDPEGLRSRTVEQLARLLHARLAPHDAARRALALQPLEQPPGPSGYLSRFSCTSMGGVAPLNRFVFVEALAGFGADGSDWLHRIAKDATCEPELRMAAIEALPLSERLDAAVAVARDDGERMPLRLAAFELVDAFSDARVVPLAEELGRVRGLIVHDEAEPIDHWRLLLTVQVLGRRHRLTTPELVTLLQSADPRRAKSHDPFTVQAEEFLDDALRIGRKATDLRALAATLLRRVVPGPMRGRLAAFDDADVNWLVGQAEAVIDRRGSPKVREAAVRAVAEFLAVFAARMSPIGSSSADVHGQVPLIESVLMELARIADDEAIAALTTLLQDRAHPQRAAAAVALGATRRGAAAPSLLYALKDDDPFVRLCCYLALRHLTGQDFFVDWLAASGSELEKGFRQWGEWIVRHGR